MPRGRPKKIKEEAAGVIDVAEGLTSSDGDTVVQTDPAIPAPPPPVAVEPKEQKGPKLEPLAKGQRYFEAPDGEIIIGEESADRVWSRKMNGGKGGWCNPRR